jgi:hypothetical protein
VIYITHPGWWHRIVLHRDGPRKEIDIEFPGKARPEFPARAGVRLSGHAGGHQPRLRCIGEVLPLRDRLAARPHRWQVDGSPCTSGLWDPTPIPDQPLEFNVTLWSSKSTEFASPLRTPAVLEVDPLETVVCPRSDCAWLLQICGPRLGRLHRRRPAGTGGGTTYQLWLGCDDTMRRAGVVVLNAGVGRGGAFTDTDSTMPGSTWRSCSASASAPPCSTARHLRQRHRDRAGFESPLWWEHLARTLAALSVVGAARCALAPCAWRRGRWPHPPPGDCTH